LSFQPWSLTPPVRYDRSADAALSRAAAGEPLDVYDSPAKLWGLFVLSIVFVMGGVLMYQQGQQVKGLIVVTFFFAAGAFILWRLINSSAPALRFDADGITIRRSGGPLRLRWSGLRSAYVASVRNRPLVCLLPADPEAALGAASPALKAIMRANIALVGAPYALPTALTLGVNDLLRVIHAYAPSLAVEPTTPARRHMRPAGPAR
jgi:hypothetical protein